ncbi:MAG TPA: TerC family protein [Proteobacteria bacterium]|nr:integral membrane protein TerC family protein [bacterium BMS3Abin14]HDL53570.1 TerC family protein [Pseudomonadota bacterium]
MWDLGWFGHIAFNLQFFSALLSIIIINIILSGDNAVVIALAVRSLPKKQRLWGIILGSGLAVFLRIILTFFAAKLLMIEFLKLGGGLLIAWIAVKLFTEGADESEVQQSGSIGQAVRVILIADLVMSVDNVLGVAGASQGNMFLLIFGLGSSIPLIVGTSTLLSMLMDRYPIIVYIGSAILGKVAGDMIITDPFVERVFHPSQMVEYAVMAIFIVGVLVVGRALLKRKIAKQEALINQ